MATAAGIVQPTSTDRGDRKHRDEVVDVGGYEIVSDPRVVANDQAEHEPDEKEPPELGSSSAAAERRILPGSRLLRLGVPTAPVNASRGRVQRDQHFAAGPVWTSRSPPICWACRVI